MLIGAFALTTSLFFILLKISKSENKFLKKYLYVPARKSKTNAIQLGGLPLGVGIIASMGICILFPELLNVFSKKDIRIVQNFIIAGGLVTAYGYLDDMFELKPTVKLGCQVLSVVIYATFSSHLLSSHHSQIVFLIICFWGLGVVNGSNLLDGLDTLTLKIGMVSYSVFMFLGAYHQSSKIFVCASLFMACLMAFYFFNREPAKIHLGEVGGSLVGFSMLLLSSFLWDSVKANHWSPVRSGVLAIIPLTLPMVELGVSFVRRIYNKKSPFRGDTLHVHHILNREFGIKPSNVASIMALGYFLTMATAVYIQILVHPYFALMSVIVLQCVLYLAIGWPYWKSEDAISITPSALLEYLSKKDVTIIESSQIDNFRLTILEEGVEEEDESDDTDVA